MKRSDDVFFFTLIDFLLQAIFFGLVLFTVEKTREQRASGEHNNNKAAIDTLVHSAGVSNIVELTDLLTKLVPARDLRAKLGLLNGIGGWNAIGRLRPLIDSAGGLDTAEALLRKYGLRQEGFGKPPCVYELRNGRKIPRPVATVSAMDTLIRFDGDTPELDSALALLGRRYDASVLLSLADFRRVFSPLIGARPECRYWLRFREYTRFVDARDAARFAFTLDIQNMRNAKR